MDPVTVALLLIIGGLMGIGVGLGAGWLLWIRPKDTELRRLRVASEQVAWLEQTDAKMREAFEALASQSLRTNSDEFLNRSKSELSNLVTPLTRDLEKLDTHIRELEEKRAGAYQGLREHLQQLGQAQASLHETTTTLKEALKSSGTRGHWGELQLQRVVELAGMTRYVDFEEQVSTGDGRPDLVVHLPNGGVVPVDAKVPMGAYIEATATEDTETRNVKLDAHAQAVRSRVRQLARKGYWTQFERAPEFVVMFVPNESCLSAAFEHDGSLLDDAMKDRVLIASPVSLLAVLKAVGYGWQQVSIAQNAQQIAEEGRTLYERIATLAGHIKNLGGHLDSSVTAYNSMIGSLEHRLLPSARRFEELGVETEGMEPLESIDSHTRKLTVDEMTGD